MRILVLNWRCPKNPRAGGAELFTHEVMKRLVARGDAVEWFSSTFPGAAAEEDLDGVHLVRAGHQWTVHAHAVRRYFRRLRPRFDVVIDEVNTVPFFTPLWADVPIFMLIFQLARHVWWYESRFPISLFGFVLEPLYLRCYRGSPAFTASRSTVEDLRRLGFSGPLTILPVGIDKPAGATRQNGETSTFLYVGRLSPSKRINHIIRAFEIFHRDDDEARLWLVGDGPPKHVRALHRLVGSLRLENSVSFFGRVSTEEKYQRMAEAHALVMASVREGWGLAVSEANACGTPTVAYDVAGLRDSVRHEETGLLVAATPQALAEGMSRIWRDRSLHRRLAGAALLWSDTLSFDRSAEVFRATIADSLSVKSRS